MSTVGHRRYEIQPTFSTLLTIDPVESHHFWKQATTLVDPHDTIGHHPSSNNGSQLRYSPYRHFRSITSFSCLVCRINAPYTNMGLAIAKRNMYNRFLGSVGLCRDHKKESFCGSCLRQGAINPHPNPSGTDYYLGLQDNEDEETWPGVEMTCKNCRADFLWMRVRNSLKDREAVGGPKFSSPDWETRQSVDGFIEMSEGTISDVLHTAQEKHWLRKYTKMPDMLSQALAATRFSSRDGGGAGPYDSDDELSDIDDMEDDEDPELLQMTEDAGGVKELAMNDWARNRILDGHWFSPADMWYKNKVDNQPSVVRAFHPCPWNRDATYTGAMGEGEGEVLTAEEEEMHPRPVTYRSEAPPSFQLCEQAYIAYGRQMRMILFPAMLNIVRKFVIECGADGIDPAIRVAKMDLEDVIIALRDEAIWYQGFDWLEKRRNERREAGERSRRRKEDASSDDSSASSKSADGSNTTSPVLSTTTLQTTPSPSPSEEDKKEDERSTATAYRPRTFPIAPVLDPPRLIHPIPYIPVTTAHMPTYSIEAFRNVSFSLHNFDGRLLIHIYSSWVSQGMARCMCSAFSLPL